MEKAAVAALLAAVCLTGGLSLGQEPGVSYEHLKFLEPMIGPRQLTMTQEGKSETDSVEVSEWIFNKNFVSHTGWGPFQGKPIRYQFVAGWNAKTQKVFAWGAGGNSEVYGIEQRIGSYDPDKKVFSSRAEAVFSDGGERRSAVKLTIVDEKTVTLDFTEVQINGKPVPDWHILFSPQVTLKAPEFDETPGPGYEHLKPIEWLVGDWELRGAWADGKPHEGGEHSEWALNKNFIQGEGWFKNREGKRVEYVYMIACLPKEKKFLCAFCDNHAGHAIRVVGYNAETKTLAGHQEGVTGDGQATSGDVRFQLVAEGRIEAIGSGMLAGEESVPNLKTVFTRK